MNIQFIITAVLIIILLVITLYICNRLTQYNIKYSQTVFNYMPLILNQLQSGDLILFRSNIINYKYLLFSHSYFTHVGIVLKDNNILYICEKNMPNHTRFSNSNINILLDRIKEFNGNCYVMKLNKPLNSTRQQLLTYFVLKDKFIDPILYANAWNSTNMYFRQLFKLRVNYKYMHCFQYVAYILDYINITNNLHKYNNIEICNKVNNLFKQPLNDGYSYKKPVQVK